MEQFMARGSISKNKGLIEHLQQYGIIKSKKVAEVMETVDRGLFVPDGSAAYIDSPMPIGYNATISAPHMHGMCLELLRNHLQPGMRALDIGSGRSVGVEHIPELVASSVENIKKSAAAELMKAGSLSVHASVGAYDAIHVGAAAHELPEPLVQQLKPGGRMVIPVGNIFQELKVVDKKLDGSISVHDETSVRYVPLTSSASQLHGY
ncbi:unnamed protein product [Spirodela intermedia]|uniref:Uncharacterized protein n=1 Tax=Spirodela intermedia TaxID=51605 RepID=A0A7I8J1M9_SPIIN|nr:unnamed protein product [Spirodela intermedia]CAA6664124.1 unnamed protein product [Spirodela intermedia]